MFEELRHLVRKTSVENCQSLVAQSRKYLRSRGRDASTPVDTGVGEGPKELDFALNGHREEPKELKAPNHLIKNQLKGRSRTGVHLDAHTKNVKRSAPGITKLAGQLGAVAKLCSNNTLNGFGRIPAVLALGAG